MTPSTIQNENDPPMFSRLFVMKIGRTKKSPTATTRLMPSVKPMAVRERPPSPPSPPSSATSPAAWSAEIASARRPRTRLSARATTPRTIGTRSQRRPCAQGEIAPSTTWMVSSGRRTATDQLVTPRIITPSMTAWPPTCPAGAARAARRSLGRRLLAARKLALEALDPASGVDQLLLAGVERVAVAADLHLDLRLGGAGGELRAARAPHVGLDVLGMDLCLQGRAFRFALGPTL